jgi:hypothetical protein
VHPIRPAFALLLPVAAASAIAACSSGSSGPSSTAGLAFRADVQPVESVAAAQKGVFIPPFLDCRAPLPGETGQGPGGQVCTHVAISGCTEPGKYFPSYASCDVVRTQRPYFPTPPAAEPLASDPRLGDAAFMGELAWVTQQVEATGCACCHDARSYGGKAAEWDIRHGPIWLDTLSNTGLALFVGLADSSALGAYPAADNHGFDRTATGLPTTDTARLKTFLLQEVARRGLTQAQEAQTPPFGGPIYTNLIAKPTVCGAGEGVGRDGRMSWNGPAARYVYVLADGTANPGVPPNLDLPAGTLWRLDVLASAGALPSGISYGETPAGSFQALPDQARAPALEVGTRYHFYVLRDVGLPLANCLFVYGQPGAGEAGTVDARAAASDANVVVPDGGPGPGQACSTSSDCPADASYCAVQPGQTTGYCTLQGCKTDAGICPGGWSCLDLSQFSAGLPSICSKP